MKHLISFLLASLLFIAPTFATDWSSVAEKSLKSLVGLQVAGNQERNFCSGTVIDSQRDYILTADHCIVEALKRNLRFTVDHQQAMVVLRDIPEDLAVIRAETDKPAMKAAKNPAKVGDFVMALGYAYSYLVPQVRISNVTYSGITLNDGYCNSKCLGVAIDHIGGMSGGPVTDHNGDMIGIVQFGDGKTGMGRNIEIIKARVGRYFEGTK